VNRLAIVLCFFISNVSAQAPYPPSTIITGVAWDTTTRLQFGAGSDQWPMTWAGDDHLYAAWGDGYGWNTNESNDPKRSIGVTRIAGVAPHLSGTDTWGAGPGSSFGKPDALVAFDSKLYMFWVNGDSRFDHDSYSAVSSDSGKTWTLGHERIFRYAPPGFRVRGILQYGKDYAGAPDDYLYIYFGFNRHPDIYLARVRKDDIFDGDAYEWYAYTKPDGSAAWTDSFHRKSVVFHDDNGYLWHVGVSYNAGLKRYLLTKPHFDKHDNRDHILADIAGLGIFEAPTPWGPWSTVFYQDDFLDGHVKFSFFIPTKFISSDGKSFWLAFSGWPEYDNVNFIKGRLIVGR